MSDTAQVIPLGSPNRAELWLRQQMALAVLSHRGCTAEAAEVVARVLQGDLTGKLVDAG